MSSKDRSIALAARLRVIAGVADTPNAKTLREAADMLDLTRPDSDETGAKPIVSVSSAFDQMLQLCRDMENWLRPEVVKEPERTFFWRLVDVVRKAERAPPLKTT